MNQKILVCPVAFNENVKIKRVIERFLKSPARPGLDYLIVDDCSTDDTTDIIKSYASQGVRTIKHEKRSGVGAAIRTAIRYAQKNGYEVLVIMAGNDKDNPDEIPNVIGPIIKDGYDFVQGSRYYGKKGTGGDMPFYRKVATKLYPLVFSMCVGRRLTDTSNGFRAFRLSLFKDARFNIDQDWLNQYELEPYLLYKSITLGYKFTEAFVTKIYPPKKLGYTKMKPITGWWSIFRPLVFLRLGIKK
ncbi:MAG: glycosyltransferase family 2 protein [Candidatus Omnitrophica bacterium]|nr:glycosyltransferase family 2 protein [Candidatus Omnitrophota bacterium]